MQIIKNILLIALILPLLTSCGEAYSSKFNCPDASGYGCTNIAVVYQRIISGQIEELNTEKKKKNCKSRSCRLKKESEIKPEFKELRPSVVEFVGN